MRFWKNQSSVAMEHEKEQKAGIQCTVDLMMHQWKDLDSHLQDFLEPKGVSLGDSVEESEKTESFASKFRELNERENEILLKVRESELREREREEVLEKKQKMLDKRILKQKVKERVLAKRENENRSELEGIEKRESELQLGMKNLVYLEKALDVEIMMFDKKTEPSQESDSNSAAKMKISFSLKRGGHFRASGSGKNAQKEPDFATRGDSTGKMNERKRSRNGDSGRDTQHEASIRVNMNQDQDGLSFWMNMSKTHQTKNCVRVILETKEAHFPTT